MDADFFEWQARQEVRLREGYRQEKRRIKTLRLMKPITIDLDEEPVIETIIAKEGPPSSQAAVADGTRPTNSPAKPLFVYNEEKNCPEPASLSPVII